MIWLLLLLFIGLLLVKMPVSYSIFIAATVSIIVASNLKVLVIVQRMYTAAESFTLIAVPFFILAGGFMEGGGISERIVNFSSALVGHIRGSLGMTTVVASMFLAGISGSGAADTAAIGSIMVPAMEKDNYGKDVATGIVATGGAIGVIIPPSLPMVLLGVACGISIGGMFLGGFIPGILTGLVLMAVTYVYARKRNLSRKPRASFGEVLRTGKEAFWALMTIVIIFGGTMFGVFTPSEAAIVAAFYTLFIGLFVYRELRWRDVPKIMWKSSITTGVVILCVAAATGFGWVMAAERIPSAIAQSIIGFSDNKYVILMLINLVLLLLGMVMEITPIILIVVPILYPVAMKLGVSPIHFGIMTVINMAIGTCTPPVGVTLFVAMGISKARLGDILKTYSVYLACMVFVLALVTFFPSLSTALPKAVLGIG